MTKAQFVAQFQRLRAAGYRLPLSDGVTVKDMSEEWFGTLGQYSVEDLSMAIDRLKQTKTDTFGPSIGELRQRVLEVQKARYSRLQAKQPGVTWSMSEPDCQAFLAELRACQKRVLSKNMPEASAAERKEPDHVLVSREDREEKS